MDCPIHAAASIYHTPAISVLVFRTPGCKRMVMLRSVGKASVALGEMTAYCPSRGKEPTQSSLRFVGSPMDIERPAILERTVKGIQE